MTIALLFGTRPEAIKLAPVAATLRARGTPVRLISTAQHRALLDDALALLGLTPDVDLDLMQPGLGLAALHARMMAGLGALFDREPPAMLVLQGDTLTAVAGTQAAAFCRIPVAHVEAGLRSGDRDHPFPEEDNRRVIAALATLHFAPTPRAAQALRAEGVAAGAIHVTGNTGIDALFAIRDRGRATALPAALRDAFAGFAGRRLLAVTAHRRENHGAGMAGIARALRTLADRGDIGIVLPGHPNPQAGATLARLTGDHPAIAILPPLDHPAFVALMQRAHLILSDSGGVQEEAPALGRPLLVLRRTTERPEAIDCGAARLVGTDPTTIVAEAARLLDDAAHHAAMAIPRFPFGDGMAGARIAEILRSGPPLPAQAFKSPRPTP